MARSKAAESSATRRAPLVEGVGPALPFEAESGGAMMGRPHRGRRRVSVLLSSLCWWCGVVCHVVVLRRTPFRFDTTFAVVAIVVVLHWETPLPGSGCGPAQREKEKKSDGYFTRGGAGTRNAYLGTGIWARPIYVFTVSLKRDEVTEEVYAFVQKKHLFSLIFILDNSWQTKPLVCFNNP